MAMVRITMLLFLGCATVVTNAHDNLTLDRTDDIPSQASAVPTCAADYPRMNQAQPKIIQKALPGPVGICVKLDNTGDFVAVSWRPARTFIYMFDNCGWIKKRIELPAGTSYSAGCAFTDSNLFYAVTNSRKLYQFNLDGKFEKVFATGYRFLRMTARGRRLYVSIENTKNVRVYDATNGNFLKQFSTTTAAARGLAFDPLGYLHVSTWGKTVEIFTQNGHKFKEITYPQLAIADGLLIDSNAYTIITDRAKKQVQIYRPYSNLLVKRLTGFALPLDVAMGYKCGYLLVTDYHRGIYLL